MRLSEILADQSELPLQWQLIVNAVKKGKEVVLDLPTHTGIVKRAEPVHVTKQSIVHRNLDRGPVNGLALTYWGTTHRDGTNAERAYVMRPDIGRTFHIKGVGGKVVISYPPAFKDPVKEGLDADVTVDMVKKLLDRGVTVTHYAIVRHAPGLAGEKPTFTFSPLQQGKVTDIGIGPSGDLTISRRYGPIGHIKPQYIPNTTLKKADDGSWHLTTDSWHLDGQPVGS
jgi:hypothetical protein